MKTSLISLTVTVALLLSSGIVRSSDGEVEKVTLFLTNLQTSSGGGLVPIAEGVPFTTTYVNAMAAIAFTATGELDRARAIFDVFASRHDFCACACSGGFQQFRDPATGRALVDADPNDFWIGDNAWLLTSLKYYRRATKDPSYDALIQRLVNWFSCVRSQTQGAGIVSGFRRNGELMNFKHPEGSIDVYGALEGLGADSIRTSVKEWLDSEVWVRENSCFRVGPANRFNLPLDNVSWAVLALGQEYQCLLSHADALHARSQDPYEIEVTDRDGYYLTDKLGSNPSIVVSVRPERHGLGNDTVIEYSWNSEDAWLRVFRSRDVNFAATPKFRLFFLMKGDGSANRFEVKLQNRGDNGEGQGVFIKSFLLDFTDWRKIEIPYSEFGRFDPNGPPAPLGRIGAIEFAVNNESRTNAVSRQIRIGRVWYEDSGKQYMFRVDGFDAFESERNWLWLEGTGQMTTAYGIAGQTDKYDHYLASLTGNLAVPAGISGLGLPNVITGAVDKRVPEAVASSWYIVASKKVNPFACPRASEQNGSGCF